MNGTKLSELPESEWRDLLSEFERGGHAALAGTGIERDVHAVMLFGLAKEIIALRKRIAELEAAK